MPRRTGLIVTFAGIIGFREEGAWIILQACAPPPAYAS
jgi:hypothetical protein